MVERAEQATDIIPFFPPEGLPAQEIHARLQLQMAELISLFRANNQEFEGQLCGEFGQHNNPECFLVFAEPLIEADWRRYLVATSNEGFKVLAIHETDGITISKFQDIMATAMQPSDRREVRGIYNPREIRPFEKRKAKLLIGVMMDQTKQLEFPEKLPIGQNNRQLEEVVSFETVKKILLMNKAKMDELKTEKMRLTEQLKVAEETKDFLNELFR